MCKKLIESIDNCNLFMLYHDKNYQNSLQCLDQAYVQKQSKNKVKKQSKNKVKKQSKNNVKKQSKNNVKKQSKNNVKKQSKNNVKKQSKNNIIRKRNYYPKQKQAWDQCHDIRFFMFYLEYKTDHPYFQISWLDWKVDNIYDKMSIFMNQNRQIPCKNKKQCKSADQRFKRIHFLQYQKYELAKTDIIQTSYQKIKKYLQTNQDQQCQQILQNFTRKINQKSNHMILCQKYTKINQNQLLSANNLFSQMMSSYFDSMNEITNQSFTNCESDEK